MSAPLKEQINADVKRALQEKDKQKVGTLRLILAAIKQEEVDKREAPDDAAVVTILGKMAKQRKESITQYARAQRSDLVAQETFELELIRSYMPAPLDAADVVKAIEQAIAGSGAQSIKDMGKVMGILKAQLQGRADMSEVSATVKERLS